MAIMLGKALRIIALVAIFAGCSKEQDPIIVYYSGELEIEFNWTDGSLDCPADSKIYAHVPLENFDDDFYGPYPCSFDGLTLEVMGGYKRTVILWIADTNGRVIYRGVVEELKIFVHSPNPPVTMNLYPLRWYLLADDQSGPDLELADVKMSGDGSGWIAGNYNLGVDGVVFRSGSDEWKPEDLPAFLFDWALWSISPAGADAAWAVGEDSDNFSGVIIRNDGLQWSEYPAIIPAVSASWRLFGVDFGGDGIGWAVGENNESTTVGVILKYNGSWAEFSGPAALLNYSLYDVADLPGGDFLAGGEDHATVPKSGFIVKWDETGGVYDISTPDVTVAPGTCSDAWSISDVYAISADDWWAVGTCNDPLGSFGMAFHYEAAAVGRETLPVIGGGWTLEGIWADANGEAWAVGNTLTTPVILHRDGVSGLWSPPETPASEPWATSAAWTLEAVDFPPTGWGYAVGYDSINNKGVILRYGFPE